MSEKIFWLDPATHWKAYGVKDGDGIKDAHVDDNHGSTRVRSKTFKSKQDFFSWAKKEASTPR